MPDGPNPENVGRTAGHDKEAEHPKDTAKRYVGPLADEVHQECRNRKIGERDDGIRRDVKRQDAGIPKVAHAVRHEGHRRHASRLGRPGTRARADSDGSCDGREGNGAAPLVQNFRLGVVRA